MKVVGHTATGHLVEMSMDELLNIAGCKYNGQFKDIHPGSIIDQGYSSAHRIKIGTTVDITQSWAWISELRSKERAAKDSAVILRAIADMVDKGLPSAIVPEPLQPQLSNDEAIRS